MQHARKVMSIHLFIHQEKLMNSVYVPDTGNIAVNKTV